MVDLITALQAGGSIASGLGSIFAGDNAAKKGREDARTAGSIAGTAFTGLPVFGLGGAGVTFGSGGGAGGQVQAGGPGGLPAGNFGNNFFLPGASRDVNRFGEEFVGQDPDARITFTDGGLRKVGRGGLQSDLGQVNLSLGGQDQIFNNLVNAGQGIDAGLGGLNPLQQAALGLGANLPGIDLDLGSIGALQGLLGQTTGQTFNQFQSAQNNPFLGGLAQGLGQQGGSLLQSAGQTGQQARDQQLNLLREQAQPFEERAFANLNQNLFDTGRIGTSGGALQTEAFARGLGQADLERQIAAGQEGRLAQQSQLGAGESLFGAGSNLRGFQDNILNNAFNRFNTAADFGRRLSLDRFNRTNQGSQALLGQAGGLFDLGTAAQQAPLDQQNAALRNLSNIVNQTGALQGQAISLADLSNAFASQQAAARLGQVGPALGANSGAQAQFRSDALGSLAGALAPEGGAIPALFGGIRDLFGGGGG